MDLETATSDGLCSIFYKLAACSKRLRGKARENGRTEAYVSVSCEQ
jgi:hypothetical protein